MNKIVHLIVSILFSNCIIAQSGKITGKVIDASSGQSLNNASVTLIEKKRTITSDQNGNFSFNKLEAGTDSIQCSYTGHLDKIIEEIIVKGDDNSVVNISLLVKESGGVVVTATRTKAAGESVASLLIAQKNSASVSDGITAESIKQTPDRSTSDVMKRISGASIQDDRFAIIRGLNDRYNAAFINGAPLPSTESDRKAFAFDIFPSAILDNLVIYKTATPDKVGDFAGGIIDITTKSIPAKNFTSVSVAMGFNSQITGDTRYLSETKGKTDWIGVDDGIRGIPKSIGQLGGTLTLPDVANLTKLFGDYKWGINQGTTSPNFSFQLSKGFNLERKQKEFFGALFSINYNRNFTFNEGERNVYDPGFTEAVQTGKYKDSIYNDEVVVAALANFAVKINNRNTINWKNNFSINTDNRLVKRFGSPDFTSQPDVVQKDAVRWYTSNQILSTQLGGDHQPGRYKTKVNWLASYSNVKREIPNLSRTSYSANLPSLNYFSLFAASLSQFVGTGTMFFTNSDENINSIKADITQPYKFMGNFQSFVKLGGGYQIRKRDFTSRLLGLVPYDRGGVNHDYSLQSLPENQIFSAPNLGLKADSLGGFILRDGTQPNADYDASSALSHAYLMNDQRFFKKFRLIYGARLEKFNQKLNTLRGLNDTIVINTVLTDILPSINFVYALTPKMNVRLSYSETVNRPEFRELAPFLFFDYVTQYTIEGQENLQRAKIKNYDFRYEFFPGKAQLFSVSAFYKEFKNPIELIFIPDLINQAIYNNAQSAEVYGFEAEFRTLLSTIVGINRENSFLSKFTLAANAAYVKSKVTLGRLLNIDSSKLATDRPLQGQSPYLINSSLTYKDHKSGISSTVSVNRVGDRISVAGTYLTADLYEKARTVMDFQLAKFFLKDRLEVKLNARDILAQSLTFYYDVDQGKSFSESDRVFSSYKMPKVFTFSATYKF